MSKHVAVLMGGWSSERQVSLNSGSACAEALQGEGFCVTQVDVGPDIATVLSDLRPDVERLAAEEIGLADVPAAFERILGGEMRGRTLVAL